MAVSGGLTLALSDLPTSEMKNSTQTALLFQSCLWIRLVCGYVKHTNMPIIEIHTPSNQWDDQSIQSSNHFDYLLCLLISWLNAIELQWNPALRPRHYYGPFYWAPGKNCHTFSCKKTLVNTATLLIPPIFLGRLVTILTGFHWTWVTCLIHAIPHWSLSC